jgi:iron(III) transport system ATP-binding protein
MSVVIELRDVSKHFGDVRAVYGVSLALTHGRTLALLGESGCGKTTVLRLIAGLETPTQGEIRLAGAPVAGPATFVPPERRRVGLVFQDYALFPHLTVAGNIGFGLARLPAARRRARVQEMLALVNLTDLADRYPHQLSGGQQQRVALARSLAPDPAVLLLDEPFSNLDAVLRRRLREDVRDTLRRVGATALFVTHDQEEAFSIADEVAVMQRGQIVQCGTPQEIYARPATRAIATFVGDANFVPGDASGDTVTCALGVLPLARPACGPVEVLIRPEQVQLQLRADGRGMVQAISYFGHDQLVQVCVDGMLPIHARTFPRADLTPGTPVALEIIGSVMAYERPMEAER